jgi:GH24 family phage-related lysozyme (muramidase)
MTPSKNLIDFIKKEEGCVLHTYLDTAGVLTIGIGSTMYKDGSKVKPSQTISEAQAEELLMWELNHKSKSVDAFTSKCVLTQNQFDALCSFAYNVGVGALEGSTLLKTIKLNPNDSRTQIVDDISDPSIKEWLKKEGLRAIPYITYCFVMWCKEKDPKTGKLVLSDGLIGRRLREAKLYNTK